MRKASRSPRKTRPERRRGSSKSSSRKASNRRRRQTTNKSANKSANKSRKTSKHASIAKDGVITIDFESRRLDPRVRTPRHVPTPESFALFYKDNVAKLFRQYGFKVVKPYTIVKIDKYFLQVAFTLQIPKLTYQQDTEFATKLLTGTYSTKTKLGRPTDFDVLGVDW
jgi:hypothetical protein